MTFEWEHLHIFPPYSTNESIDRQLGFRWSGAERTGIHQLDGFTLLVFVQHAEVAASVTLPRRDGDFSEIQRDEGFSREAAVFVVRRKSRGEPWFVLHEAARAR